LSFSGSFASFKTAYKTYRHHNNKTKLSHNSDNTCHFPPLTKFHNFSRTSHSQINGNHLM